MVDREITSTRITAEEYYQLPEYEEHTLIQLIDGEVVISATPFPRHQRIVGNVLIMFMTIYKNKGGEAFQIPIELYLDEYNIFELDVLYLKPDSKCTVGEKRLNGAPDLVVEVLSPGTAKYDRDAKKRAYQKHGVTEYWIVDPAHEALEVLQLNESGQFEELGVFAGDDSFQSLPLDESVSVKAIFSV